jgi:hypothetical protein
VLEPHACAKRRKPRGRQRERRGVAVEPEEPQRRVRSEQRLRVPTEAHGAVHEHGSRCLQTCCAEMLEHLREQDRSMELGKIVRGRAHRPA